MDAIRPAFIRQAVVLMDTIRVGSIFEHLSEALSHRIIVMSMRARLAAVWTVLIAFSIATIGVAQESRTWSDASGKFKIKAKFLSEEGGTVTLETEDGKELEIELKKLNSADQKIIADLKKEMSDSPFKSKENDPFKPKGTGTSKPSSKKESSSEPVTEMRVVTVDWTDADVIPLGGAGEEWNIEFPAANEFQFKSRVKTAALPAKSNFFEGIKGLAVNTVAKKAAVGFVLGEPKPRGTTRVVICDLETGKAGTPATAPGQMTPIALHDDGKQILMRREEWGMGNLDRLEVWTLKGSKAVKQVEVVPFADQNGGDKDIMWAEFIDADTLAFSSRGGRVALWKFPEMSPICYFETAVGAVPSLSPDRKYIAFSNGEQVGLFDVAKHEIAVQHPTPSKLQWPYMAFSPSGKRLGCVAFDKVLCWNAETGELINEIPANGANFHGQIDFPHDNFLLAGGKFLVDIDNQLKLWQYEGAEQLKTVGGWTFMATTDGSKPGSLLAAQLPHPGALDIQKKALTDPSLFVFKTGTKVKLDVNGITDPAARDQVLQALTKKLKDMDCTIGPDGTIDVVATVEGPKVREISFFSSGDYKMQEYVTALKFVYQGKVAWQSTSTNVPFMVHLKRGENMESHLRSLEKPQYGFYDGVHLPKFLQKPTQGTGPQAQHTIGQSRITTTGIR